MKLIKSEDYKEGDAFVTERKRGNLSVSEISSYMASLFFDMRNLHLNTTGDEFYTYHGVCQDIYEHAEEFYDDLVEVATNLGELVPMMNESVPSDWNSYSTVDVGVDATKSAIASELETILEKINSVKEGYDSFVYSKLDSMSEYFDKELYKIKQALKSARSVDVNIANGWKGSLIGSAINDNGDYADESGTDMDTPIRFGKDKDAFKDEKPSAYNQNEADRRLEDDSEPEWHEYLKQSKEDEKKKCDECADDWREYQDRYDYPVDDEIESFIHSSADTNLNWIDESEIESSVDDGVDSSFNDDSENTIEHFPQWAVTYAMYGESDDLTEEEMEMVDRCLEEHGTDSITGTVEGTENEFDNNPEFGLPTSTVTVTL